MSRQQPGLFLYDIPALANIILNSGLNKTYFENFVNRAKDKSAKDTMENYFNLVVAHCVAQRIEPTESDKIERLRSFQNLLNQRQINVKSALKGYSNIITAALHAPGSADLAQKTRLEKEKSKAEKTYQKSVSILIRRIIYAIQKGTDELSYLWSKLNNLYLEIAGIYDICDTIFEPKNEMENTLKAIMTEVFSHTKSGENPKASQLEFLLSMIKRDWSKWEVDLPSILQPYLSAVVDNPEQIELAALLLTYGTGKIESTNYQQVGEVILNASPATVAALLKHLVDIGSVIEYQWSRFGNKPHEIGPVKDFMDLVVSYCLVDVKPDQIDNMRLLFRILDENHISIKDTLNSCLGEIILRADSGQLANLMLEFGAVPKSDAGLFSDPVYIRFIEDAYKNGNISKENLHKYLPKASTDDVGEVLSAMTQEKSGSGLFKSHTPVSAGTTAEDKAREVSLAPLEI